MRVLKKDSHTLTLAEFELKTGRSHQIRAQALASGHPVVGDPKYFLTAQRNRIDFPRPALHAVKLSFPHPMTGEVLTFEAPLPLDIRNLCSF